MIEYILGILTGLLLAIVACVFNTEIKQVPQKIHDKIFRGKAEIVGLSEEQQQFRDSLKTEEKL